MLFIDSSLDRRTIELDSGIQTFSPFVLTATAGRLLPLHETTWPKAAPKGFHHAGLTDIRGQDINFSLVNSEGWL